MSRWLASVRNLEEVDCLLAESPDIIDLKEPGQGALGALPHDIVRKAVALIKGRCQTSATVGDLPMEPARLYRVAEKMAATDVDYVKIGLFPHERAPDCLMALQPLADRGISLVGVMFADKHPDFSWIPLMQQAGFKGVMLDTATKNGLGLLNHLSLPRLGRFIESAHRVGLISGLAGSLGIQDVPLLLSLKPGYLGFRGALCYAGQRKSNLDSKAISLLRRALGDNPAV